MHLPDDVHLIDSEVLVPPTVSTFERSSTILVWLTLTGLRTKKVGHTRLLEHKVSMNSVILEKLKLVYRSWNYDGKPSLAEKP